MSPGRSGRARTASEHRPSRRSRITIAHPAPLPGRAADPGLRSFLGDLTERGIVYAVLRGRSTPPPAWKDPTDGKGPAPPLEILIGPEDLDALDAVAARHGLVALGRGDGAGRAYAEHGRSEPRLVARSHLHYGAPSPYLETGAREAHVLGRAVETGGVRFVAPPDRLVDLVLHCLLDLGSFPDRERRELTDLMGHLRADPPASGRAAERVQQELAPALSWSELLASVVQERWDELLTCAAGLRFHLWRQSPVRSTIRYAIRRVGWGRNGSEAPEGGP